MRTLFGFKKVFRRAALLLGAAFFASTVGAVPMTGYVGVLGAAQYQGISEGAEASGGLRIEFARLVKFIALDLRYMSGKYNYMGGSLKFFQHWETSGGNHWTLGMGPGALYAPDGNFYGNDSQVGQPYVEYFAEGFGSFLWDFSNGVGLLTQAGVNVPFHRKYQSTSADPNNAGYLTARPFITLGIAIDVD
jgi:hypothetical protein